jgi:L-lactate dehydrogenase complex protein LldF
MTTEEISLNPALEREGTRVVETDLGEYIVQIAGQKPSHILGPSVHLSKDQISDLFYRKHGPPKLSRAEELTAQARQRLRQEFLRADMGITGVNFGIADSGTLVLIENEGNILLTVSKPRIHVAIMGIEKVIPRLEHLPNFLKLLIYSASGQRISSYVHLVSGPRRPGEIDGPEELYLILLDNGRSRILSDPFLAQTLSCIRCGACLNSCPVYQNVGGHAYASTYQGPIGAILTPQLESLEAAPDHPFASSLCGACGEVCPVKIEIPQILLKLREKIRLGKDRKSGSIQLQKLAFQIWVWCMQRPERVAGVRRMIRIGQKILLRKGHRFPPVPFLRRWMRYHELPGFPEKTFREMYAEREES